MNFATLYRLSLYLLLFLSALILNMDAEVELRRELYPIGMAVASVAGAVDRRPPPRARPRPADWPNLLGIASLFLVYLEYRVDEYLLVLACGHWLVYLTLIKMFRPKRIERRLVPDPARPDAGARRLLPQPERPGRPDDGLLGDRWRSGS